MSTLATPEVSSVFGAIDSLAYSEAAGAPLSAHISRELIRNANRLRALGGLLYRYLGVVETSSAELTQGQALAYVPPFWASIMPHGAQPVLKKSGLTDARIRMRVIVTTGKIIHYFAGSNSDHAPEISQVAARAVAATGTGAVQTIDWASVPLREADGEVLSFAWYAEIDPSTDTLMDAGYGSSTGNIQFAYEGEITGVGAPGWSTNIADVGHYVALYPANYTPGPSNAQYTHHMVVGSTATQLFIYPPLADVRPVSRTGVLTYAIYKLPNVQILSIAAYAKDAVP